MPHNLKRRGARIADEQNTLVVVLTDLCISSAQDPCPAFFLCKNNPIQSLVILQEPLNLNFKIQRADVQKSQSL
jgi:hypothetical protein